MTVLTMGRQTGEFLVSEANGRLSREVVTVAAGADLVPGTVLGQVTASGDYVALDTAATDGSEVAAAVLYDHAYAAEAPVEVAVIARLAEVRGSDLEWPDGITEGDKAAAVAELAANNIIVR